jgi:hypothetical protein
MELRRAGEGEIFMQYSNRCRSPIEGVDKDANVVGKRSALPGSGLFELCRFLYTKCINLESGEEAQKTAALLLFWSYLLQIDSLFDTCVEYLVGVGLSAVTFYLLIDLISYDGLADQCNRTALMGFLSNEFHAHCDVVSSHAYFPALLPSTLSDLVSGMPSCPSYIPFRWNKFMDKPLSSLSVLRDLIDGKSAHDVFTCSLVEIKTGKLCNEASKHSLKSKDVEILMTLNEETLCTWVVNDLYRGRPLGLFNGLFLLRHTHAAGIYELQLQNGSADPPTAHISSSSDSVIFQTLSGGPRTVISVASVELLSTPHEFRTLDLRIMHEGKTSGFTTVHLVDKFTL